MTQLWVILTFKDREDEEAPARKENQRRMVIRSQVNEPVKEMGRAIFVKW